MEFAVSPRGWDTLHRGIRIAVSKRGDILCAFKWTYSRISQSRVLQVGSSIQRQTSYGGKCGNIEVPGSSKHNLVLRGANWGTPGDFINSTGVRKSKGQIE